MAALLIAGAMTPLSAQNLESHPASSKIIQADAIYDLQPSAFHESSDQCNSSPSRKVAVSAGPQPYEISSDSLQACLALIAAVYRDTGRRADSSDCSRISLSVARRIKLDVARTLEVVESEVASNPGCAGEIVKSSIKASGADVSLVVLIVETAITVSPENMRMISKCAIATMPEAVAKIQALLARLDANSGDPDVHSSRSSKNAKDSKHLVEVAPKSANPLDIPHLRLSSRSSLFRHR